MVDKKKFVVELSQKLLGEMINGALAGGEQVEVPKFVDHAVKAANQPFLKRCEVDSGLISAVSRRYGRTSASDRMRTRL